MADELRHTLALVLAGGRGSRLKQLTEKNSKPAVPFGGKFRIIDFPLSNCVNSGIKKIAVLTQYRAHWLILHLQRGWNFLRPAMKEFVEIWPAQQQTNKESWYLGTADAVSQNMEAITYHRPRYVLILAGDHIYKQDYARMLAEHVDNGADVTVSCLEVSCNEATAFGVVDADNDEQIIGFVEKPEDPPTIPGDPDHSFVSMGIYIFNYEILMEALQQDDMDAGSSHDFGKDIIPRLVTKCKVMAHRFERSSVSESGPYWRDVGTLDGYWEANIDLTTISPELDLYDMEWPIWTYQRQYPAAKFVFNREDRRGYAVDSLVSAGCVISGGVVDNSLLFTDSRVNSYSQVTDSLLLPHSSVGRNSRINKAVIGFRCHLPEGLVVGEDAEADSERFYRSESGITLITASMLEDLKL